MKLGNLSLSIISPVTQIMLIGSSPKLPSPPLRKIKNFNLYCFVSDLEDIKPIFI